MIERLDDFCPHLPFDSIEIFDHTPGRTVVFKRAADSDVEPVRMTVQASAFALVVRENVRGLESEVLSYLHSGADWLRPGRA